MCSSKYKRYYCVSKCSCICNKCLTLPVSTELFHNVFFNEHNHTERRRARPEQSANSFRREITSTCNYCRSDFCGNALLPTRVQIIGQPCWIRIRRKMAIQICFDSLKVSLRRDCDAICLVPRRIPRLFWLSKKHSRLGRQEKVAPSLLCVRDTHRSHYVYGDTRKMSLMRLCMLYYSLLEARLHSSR